MAEGRTPDGAAYLIRLPDTLSANAAKAYLATVFQGEKSVQTSEDAFSDFQQITGGLFTFLSMVAFISLLIGGLGVAMAMRTFISQKIEHIAILKALGATSARVAGVFLTEALLLGAAGSVMGAGFGLLLQKLLPVILKEILPTANAGLNYTVILGGVGAGILTALICALLPVRAVRNVKPGALFRSDSVPVRPSAGVVLEGVLVVLVVLAGLGWLATLYANSVKIGLGFLGATLAVALVLFVVTWVLLRVVRLLPQSGFPAIRHAVRSLYATGSQASAVVVSLGLGISLIVTVYLLQSSLMAQIRQAGVGPNTPNIYLIGVSPEQRGPVRAFLEQHEGVARVMDPLSMASGTIVTVDGRTDPGDGKPQSVITLGKELPTGYKVVAGEWFTADDAGRPLLSLQQEMANQLGAKVGSQVVMRFGEKEVTFTVKVIIAKSGDGLSAGVNAPIAAAPGSLDEFVQSYVLLATSKPQQEAVVVRDLVQRYPGVTALGLGDLLNTLQEYLGKIANVIRFMTAFAVIAAGVILSGSLSATRFRRRKKSALLKTLGATRATVATSSALENAVLGAVAGCAGAGLGYVLMTALSILMKLSLHIGIVPLLIASLAGAALSMIIGTASTLDVLRVRPLTVLRGD